MPSRNVVVMGASAGGIDAVCTVLEGVPERYGGVIAIVMHIPPRASVLAQIFDRCSHLDARVAVDGECLVAGRVYVCAADHHLLLGGSDGEGVVALQGGPKENSYRPAIDALFRSAADHFGPRVAGVILSGLLFDGTNGLVAVRDRGGVAIVQDPGDAAFGDMPTHAIESAGADYVLPASEIGPLIAQLEYNEGRNGRPEDRRN